MRCKICQREFTPNKYHPHQEVCFSPECQHLRQIQNERDWRIENPEYFKCRDQEVSWRKNRHYYNQKWKVAHKEYLKEYEKSHAESKRVYMREYMRRYRIIHRQEDLLTETKVSF